MSSKARVRIRVDTEVLFNGSVGDWATKPPDLFKDAIAPGAHIAQWMKPAMVAMSDAVMLEKNIDIDITTHQRGFSMNVTDK